jgi:hypothetical protein
MDVVVFNLVEVYRRFKDTYCLHRQGDECPDYQTTRNNIPEDILIPAAVKTRNLTKIAVFFLKCSA